MPHKICDTNQTTHCSPVTAVSSQYELLEPAPE